MTYFLFNAVAAVVLSAEAFLALERRGEIAPSGGTPWNLADVGTPQRGNGSQQLGTWNIQRATGKGRRGRICQQHNMSNPTAAFTSQWKAKSHSADRKLHANASGAPAFDTDGRVATPTGQCARCDQQGATTTSMEVTDAPLVVHAGGTHTLVLPDNAVVLRGSVSGLSSQRDRQRVRFRWQRDQQSPAAGDVLLGSAGAAELLLCNLVEGTYVFHLRATDHRGRSGTAAATVEVRAEPGADQQVELELLVPVSQVSVSQLDTLVRQLAALLHVDNAHILLRGLRPRSPVSCVLRVCVLAPDGGGLLPARAVLRVLRKELMGDDEGFLLFPVLNVDSVVCVLECSGRGQCDPIGRKCLCRHLWTENLVRRYLGDGETNCEWDLLSVALSGLVIVLIILVIARTLVCCGKRRRVKVRKRSRYAILPNAAEDDEERMELRPKFGAAHRATNGRSSLAASESEWDSVSGGNAHP